MSERDHSALVTFGAVTFSLAIAALVSLLAESPSPARARSAGPDLRSRVLGMSPSPARARSAEPTLEARDLPALTPEPETPVPAGWRAVPESVLASAGERAAPWAPGLELVEVSRAEDWREHRALFRDLAANDVRAYAIGDLLPHGSLLVSIGVESAEILVGDREIVEMRVGAPNPRSVFDFRSARAPRSLSRAPELSETYVSAALEALSLIRDGSPEDAQAAIDALIGAGEPVIEVIIPLVDDGTPLEAEALELPSGSGRWMHPSVLGDAVVGALEAITGQTFGEVTRAATPAERAEIAGAWLRWWGM